MVHGVTPLLPAPRFLLHAFIPPTDFLAITRQFQYINKGKRIKPKKSDELLLG